MEERLKLKITRKKIKPLLLLILSGLVGILLLTVASILIYYASYDRALKISSRYLDSTEEVKVLYLEKNTILFDGEGTDTCIIFYPSEKVEYTSYARMMNYLARNGIDCFLFKMPLNSPTLNTEKGAFVLDDYKYKNIYVMGHNNGGMASSIFTSNHLDDIDGLILLASYSPKKIESDSLKVLSIYGDKDQLLNQKLYEKNKPNLKCMFTEIIIEGANNSYFGEYGLRKNDGAALMHEENQIEKTVDLIIDFINN